MNQFEKKKNFFGTNSLQFFTNFHEVSIFPYYYYERTKPAELIKSDRLIIS